MKPNGAILYKGPSLLNGQPIVAMLTGLRDRSNNRKTGSMLQTWILRDHGLPVDHIRRSQDQAICGDCPHSASRGRTCYVNVGQAPQAVYRAYRRGSYPRVNPADIAALGDSRIVRLGSYGDPAAVPTGVWSALVSQAKGHTGYTHQWRTAPDLRELCMASVDSPDEAREAQSRGWRTFRVTPITGWRVEAGEVLCPASEEAGKRTNCASCRLCGGASKRAKSVVIPAHGAKRRRVA